ncbi:hypothetical protein [Terrimonas pollutisoli]|uniref:hypothetical protein n=1 Tax=Terrimonas pollutisoli TaxID=3034147 RepID=UPI0023ED196F|nr:hypothetical protein [Terrimonas sp. H1YJ31]
MRESGEILLDGRNSAKAGFTWLGIIYSAKKKRDVPDITIASQKVWIEDEAETFNDVDQQLLKT